MIYFETSRLRLRDWQESDLESFRQLNSDPLVMKYFPNPLSFEETDELYESFQSRFAKYGFGRYVVETKVNDEFIGFIGFHMATFQADFTPCIEIGWRLKKEAWGNGYATEGAAACLEFGFNTLRFEEIYSFTADINTPSKNVMIKIGMEFVKEFHHPKVDIHSPLCNHVLFQIKKFKGE